MLKIEKEKLKMQVNSINNISFLDKQNFTLSNPAYLNKTVNADSFVKSKTVAFGMKTRKIIPATTLEAILKKFLTAAARQLGLPEGTSLSKIIVAEITPPTLLRVESCCPTLRRPVRRRPTNMAL
jgi:hypothetical protein